MNSAAAVITLYVVPDCPLCENVRVNLRANGIDFLERDVSADYSALRSMFKLSRQKFVPVIEKSGGAYLVRPSVDALISFCSK